MAGGYWLRAAFRQSIAFARRVKRLSASEAGRMPAENESKSQYSHHWIFKYQR